MARPIRLHLPGNSYHVMSRGNDKQCIFTDDCDYARFLHVLSRAALRCGVKCHAYCLLWNHYHLLVTPGEIPVSRMMQQLNSTYCQWFNRRHKRVGHVLQGRFKGLLVDDASYFLHALRYVLLNPVEADQVTHPGDWCWSSYRATAGVEPVPEFLDLMKIWAALDATDESDARQRFAALVAAGQREPTIDRPVFVGTAALQARVADLLEPHRSTCEFVYRERFAARPPLANLLMGVTDRPSLERAVARAFCTHAYTLSEIGAQIGRPVATVWVWVQRGERGERGQISIF